MSLENIQNLVMLKGRINRATWVSMYKKEKDSREKTFFEKVGLPFIRDIQDKNELLKLYLKRKYGIGGKKVQSYIGVLRMIRGVEKKVKDSLGEVVS